MWNSGRDIFGISSVSLLGLPSAWTNTFLVHSPNLYCLTILIQEDWLKLK